MNNGSIGARTGNGRKGFLPVVLSFSTKGIKPCSGFKLCAVAALCIQPMQETAKCDTITQMGCAHAHLFHFVFAGLGQQARVWCFLHCCAVAGERLAKPDGIAGRIYTNGFAFQGCQNLLHLLRCMHAHGRAEPFLNVCRDFFWLYK